jgi:hypothetical protein
MIRLSGQCLAEAALAAARSDRARRAPVPPGGEVAGLSLMSAFRSVIVRLETEGQDGQVVVQVTSVELADAIDHLVEQLVPGLIRAAEGVLDQLHQAFAAEPL